MVQEHFAYTRFEAKYLIDPALYPDIREFIRPFAQPDRFAVSCPGHRYRICSLYLDSLDLRLYTQVLAGEKARFKLRIRSYSDDPSEPVFLEVKLRHDKAVRKTRVALERKWVAELLARDPVDPPPGLPRRMLAALESFNSYKALVQARPVLRVRYVREAYEARSLEPVRITFDTELMHSLTFGENFDYEAGSWVPTPVRGGIVEVKFTDRFPYWVQDMVRFFGMKQVSVPKYVLSVDELLAGDRASAVSVAGFTLPPRTYAEL